MRYESSGRGAVKACSGDVWSVLCRTSEVMAQLVLIVLSLRAVLNKEAREWR